MLKLEMVRIWFGLKWFIRTIVEESERAVLDLNEDISANACDLEDDVVQITQIKKFTYLRIKQRLDDTLELPLPETAQKLST